MANLKTFNLSIGAVILRFYLMMGVVLIAGFSGYWLIALLALPIFLSIMMGITFTKDKEERNVSAIDSSLKSTPKSNLPNVA